METYAHNVNDRDEGPYVGIIVDPLFLPAMFTPHKAPTRCLEGLPPGAAFVGMDWTHWVRDHWNDQAQPMFVFRHASFAVVPVGAPLPQLSPMFQIVFAITREETLTQVGVGE